MAISTSVLNGIHSDNIFVPGTGNRPAESMTDRMNAIEANKLDTAGAFMGGYKNKIINGNFTINQRVVSGTVTLSAGAYGHDRWKAGASGCTYTFSTVENVTTITITAGSLLQIIEGLNLFSGTHILTWQGTAQGKIGAGSYSASGITGIVTGGTNLNIEFGTGTLRLVQFEMGSVATPFEYRHFAQEFELCQRYYEKSYNYNVPAGSASNYGSLFHFTELSSTATYVGHSVSFAVEKRTIPTTYVFSPLGSSNGYAQLINNNVAASTMNAGTRVMTVFLNAVYVTAGSTVHFHWVADAEL